MASLSGLRIPLIAASCHVGCGCIWNPALLWLWHRLAAAGPMRPLAWELPYATGAAIKKKKNKKQNKKDIFSVLNKEGMVTKGGSQGCRWLWHLRLHVSVMERAAKE